MSENVFQIFRRLKEHCPFVVQRTTSASCVYLVTDVQPAGKYGDAYGYPLPPAPPLTGAAYGVNPHYGTTGREGPVKNAGSYQWVLVTRDRCPADWPDDWKAACPAPE